MSKASAWSWGFSPANEKISLSEATSLDVLLDLGTEDK